MVNDGLIWIGKHLEADTLFTRLIRLNSIKQSFVSIQTGHPLKLQDLFSPALNESLLDQKLGPIVAIRIILIDLTVLLKFGFHLKYILRHRLLLNYICFIFSHNGS